MVRLPSLKISRRLAVVSSCTRSPLMAQARRLPAFTHNNNSVASIPYSSAGETGTPIYPAFQQNGIDRARTRAHTGCKTHCPRTAWASFGQDILRVPSPPAGLMYRLTVTSSSSNSSLTGPVRMTTSSSCPSRKRGVPSGAAGDGVRPPAYRCSPCCWSHRDKWSLKCNKPPLVYCSLGGKRHSAAQNTEKKKKQYLMEFFPFKWNLVHQVF